MMHPGAVLTALLSLGVAAGAWCWVLYERNTGKSQSGQADARLVADLQAKVDERESSLTKLKTEHQAALDKLQTENKDLRRQLAEAIEAGKPPPTPAEVAERVRAARELAFARVPDWTPSTVEEIRQRLATLVSSGLTQEEADARVRALVAMGFVTEKFDYRTAAVNLAQVKSGGFYDGATGKFLYQSDASLARADSREVFAGAVLPVLIGQNFNLSGTGIEPNNDDAVIALQALAAGDANFFRVRFSLADQLRANNDRGQAPAPPLQPDAPQFLTEMWKWTEDAGNLFVQSLHQKGGTTAINLAYTSPPRSSAEILHPEKLFLSETPFKPVKVTFADAAVNGTAPLFTNVAGEAASYMLIRHWADVDTAENATVGWAGDRYLVWPGSQEHGDHVLWRTVWTTEKDADEYFAVMRAGLMSRHLIPWQKEYDAVPGQFRVDDPHRIIRIKKDGKSVTLLNATDPAFAKAAEEKFLTAQQ